MLFQNLDASFPHGEVPKVGILLTNLGTPDAPTQPALKRYLREFLSDPRVIELPRFKWWLILNLFILTTRPKASAKLYETVWTQQGSPLLTITQEQAAGVEAALRERLGSPFAVAIGMRYGNPSIRKGLLALHDQGCRRILVLPLYPQYSASTTGSTFDALSQELTTWRWVSELRTVHKYHDDPLYIGALAASIREVWQAGGEPEKLLFSFHGIPQRYFDGGDPYHCECHKTARLVAEQLEIDRQRYVVAFQSLFGKEEWIKPYTASTVEAMARAGIKSLDILCPGFSADCLETLEEIDVENRKIFLESGGESFRYIRALNSRPDHIQALAEVIWRNLLGWVLPSGEWDQAEADRQAEASRRRADDLAALALGADGGFGQ
ncbi:MAG: ferrochelatase [Acidobacteria bacterium]|nr:ferrochelatase [Acidobacteriota bacterium]